MSQQKREPLNLHRSVLQALYARYGQAETDRLVAKLRKLASSNPRKPRRSPKA